MESDRGRSGAPGGGVPADRVSWRQATPMEREERIDSRPIVPRRDTPWPPKGHLAGKSWVETLACAARGRPSGELPSCPVCDRAFLIWGPDGVVAHLLAVHADSSEARWIMQKLQVTAMQASGRLSEAPIARSRAASGRRAARREGRARGRPGAAVIGTQADRASWLGGYAFARACRRSGSSSSANAGASRYVC